MHVFHDYSMSELAYRGNDTFLLLVDERHGDDPKDAVGAGERDERAGYDAHEPYSAPAVHEVPGVFSENAGKALGSLEEGRAFARVGTAATEMVSGEWKWWKRLEFFWEGELQNADIEG